jgi:hypothetical protein
MIPKNIEAQVDWSGGQVDDIALRRDDSKVARISARVQRNVTPGPTGPASTRPGRRLLSVGDQRCDDFQLSTGVRYTLCFSATRLRIRVRTGGLLKTFTGLAWQSADVPYIRWAQFGNYIILCVPGLRTKTLNCIGAPSAWTMTDFAFATDINGTIRQPYFRFAALGVTMQPAAYSGLAVNVAFSASVMTAGHVGQRIRYIGREMHVVSQTGNAAVVNIIETLPNSYSAGIGGTPGAYNFDGFHVGDECGFKLSPSRVIITRVTSGTIYFVARDGSFIGGVGSEELIGPKARAPIVALGLLPAPEACVEWDEPVINDTRGWPGSVTADQARLVFCQLPAMPDAVTWSTVNEYADFAITGDEGEGIFERLQGEHRVLDVVTGADIFVLTDKGVFYVPVSADNPLVSGSVEFRSVENVGSSPVRAVSTGSGAFFVDSGQIGIWAIVQTGQTTRPYLVRELTALCRPTVNAPVALGYQTGETANPERFVYAVMGDGAMLCGRFDPINENMGWFQWDGGADVTWVSTHTTGALLTSSQTLGGTTFIYCEELTIDSLTDAEVDPVTPGAALDADKPGGAGPLWMFAGGTVRLRQGARDWGDRAVSALGVMEVIESDDVTGSGWRVGLFFTRETSPFVWQADPGPSRMQRHRRRRVERTAWTMKRNCAFEVEDAGGRVQRVPAHHTRDDHSVAAPTRLEQHRFRHTGRSFDPEITLRQVTVGSLTLIEFSPEAGV